MVRPQKFRSIEQLEARQVMAGSVLAAVDIGGNLLIRGDGLANSITLTQTSNGTFNLSGHDTTGDVATRINGQTNGTAQLTGVTGSITIISGDGDDNIEVTYLNHAGSLVVNSGDGDDSIALGSNGASSFLVGGLSIRTQEGADYVSETKFNVIGYHDFAATQTDGGVKAGNTQNLNIVNSTFGSLLYLDFGARSASLNIQNVVVSGVTKVFNQLVTNALDGLGHNFSTPVQVNQFFFASIESLSTAGVFDLNSTLISQVTVNAATGLSSFGVSTLGTTNSLNITNSSFQNLSNQTKTSYSFTVVGGLTQLTTTQFVESSDDVVNLSNVYAWSRMNLQSSGGLTVQYSFASEAYLAAYNNAHAAIGVKNSSFNNLTLALGSLNGLAVLQGDTAAQNATNQITTALVEGCQVTGALVIDGTTRAQQFTSTTAIRVSSGVAINQAIASFTIVGSVVNHFNMPVVVDTPPPGSTTQLGRIAGSVYLNALNSIFGDVNLNFAKSNDLVSFTQSTVNSAIAVDGGGGKNTFYNLGSTLNNLTLNHFS